MALDIRLLGAEDVIAPRKRLKTCWLFICFLAAGVLLVAVRSDLDRSTLANALTFAISSRPRASASAKAAAYLRPRPLREQWRAALNTAGSSAAAPQRIHTLRPGHARTVCRAAASEGAEYWKGRLDGAPPPAPEVVLKESPPFVVLPGFGNAGEDYIAPLKQPEEVGLASALRRRGVGCVEVLPLERTAWFNVLRGLFDINFWRGDAQPDGPAYGWYLELAKATVEKAVAARKESPGDPRAVLVGHSAGGWLARALCLNETWAKDHVRGIVTLGAPHDAGDGLDRTRGTVTNVNRIAPGAFLSPPFFYVTVASARLVGNATAPPGTPAKSIYNSYLEVCGEGAIAGDGVVPLKCAHLDGATQLTLNCYHSITVPWTALPTDEWYAAEPFIDDWLGAVASKLNAPA